MANIDANGSSPQFKSRVLRSWEPVLAMLLTAVLPLVVASCNGAGPQTDSPHDTIEASRPAGVPDEAVPVTSERTFGSLGPGSEEESRLFAVECHNNLLAIVTSRVRVYAELPCDRALPPDKVQEFLGDPVVVRVRIGGDDNKLFFQSQTTGSVEFTTGRVWIAEQPA